jgi:hypothetical protein
MPRLQKTRVPVGAQTARKIPAFLPVRPNNSPRFRLQAPAMKKVLFALILVLGCSTLGGCGPSQPSNTPPPPQDSGADKNKKALFPIPEEKEQEPKK